MFLFLYASLSFFLLLKGVACTPKLLVVSYDGFRFDYLYRNLTPNLNSLKTQGSYSKFMINVFPTQTFTNHFTVATGLYSEDHGVLASHVFDSKRQVLMEYSYDLFHYNDKIVPIWTLNERAGGKHHSGVMMWPGSEFSYTNLNATFRQPFDDKIPWEKRVDTVMTWMKHSKTPANLVMMYFEEPDMESHVFGPDSKQVDIQIARVDKITKYILDSLKNYNLGDVNIIFLSDHGMELVPKSNIIDLNPIVGNITNMYGTSPVLQVYPKSGVTEKEVIEKLQQHAKLIGNFKAYKKESIPDYLHYKKCERAPPITVIADPPYAFQDLFTAITYYQKQYNISGNGPFGVHGYDPKDINMHPFFIATGPIFKKNHISGNQIMSIDMYLLFAHILELELPSLKPNGTLSHLSDLFITVPNRKNFSKLTFVLGVSIVVSFAIIAPLFVLYLKKSQVVLPGSRQRGKRRKASGFDEKENEEPLLDYCEHFLEAGVM